MRRICIHDKAVIEKFLADEPGLHIYEIGDLDDFFWPYTTWYASEDAGQIQELALVYHGAGSPVILAISEQPERMQALLASLLPVLPREFYAHLSPGIEAALTADYQLDSHGPHYKMLLRDPAASAMIDTSQVSQLTSDDLAEVLAFYEVSYPENFFDPRMLESGCYFAMREEGKMVSIAGIHVYSPLYRVAAIGNVTTHPSCRGRGLGTITCAKLCQELLKHVDQVGLNVKADNLAAISCYKRLGFEIVAEYVEVNCVARQM
jgi:ribosomal protein S18 acetylase RimI-like enzyme